MALRSADDAGWMSGKFRARLAQILTRASSWMSDRSTKPYSRRCTRMLSSSADDFDEFQYTAAGRVSIPSPPRPTVTAIQAAAARTASRVVDGKDASPPALERRKWSRRELSPHGSDRRLQEGCDAYEDRIVRGIASCYSCIHEIAQRGSQPVPLIGRHGLLPMPSRSM